MGIQSLVSSGGGTDWSKQTPKVAVDNVSLTTSTDTDHSLLLITGSGFAQDVKVRVTSSYLFPVIKVDGVRIPLAVDNGTSNFGVWENSFNYTATSSSIYFHTIKLNGMIRFNDTFEVLIHANGSVTSSNIVYSALYSLD